MACIRKRGSKWQVQVRRANIPPLVRSFNLKSDAEIWARQMEVAADRDSLPVDPSKLRTTTVAQLIERYKVEVTPGKRSSEYETIMLNAFLRQPWANLTLDKLHPQVYERALEDMNHRLKPESIRRQLTILQHVFDIALKRWGFPLKQNPIAVLRKPKPGLPRSRRPSQEEVERLLDLAHRRGNGQVGLAVALAIETGLRRGELLAIRRQDIDWPKGLLCVPVTKTGYPRVIPLTTRAINILGQLSSGEDDRLFQMTANALRLAWERLKAKAGIEDLHFHDLRHEAVSRFFKMGLSVPEVALISGHRDYRMLFRYTHLRPEDVARKITSTPRG
jgi:integrase